MRFLAYIPALLTVCAIGFYLLSLWSSRSFFKLQKLALSKNFFTPVSILKPVKGAEAETYESFRSHCLQYYAEYEILFGVASLSDPAVLLVERLKTEFPERAIQLVVCPESRGANPKLSTLIQMLPLCRYRHLLINDSDIRVPTDYLRKIMNNFVYSKVGMVTTLYRPVPANTLGSRLEALGISTDFSAGVLTARLLEGGLRFALGSTMAISRHALEEIGGLEAIADYLADDYEIGNRVAAHGLDVVLSDAMVETYLPAYTFGGFLQHQMRWARTVHAARPWGYLGIGLTFGLPWALITLLAARAAAWSVRLFVVCLLLRFITAWVVGVKALNDRRLLADFWLLPLRDVMALASWVTGFTGDKIQWRGSTFTLVNGKLLRVEKKDRLPT